MGDKTYNVIKNEQLQTITTEKVAIMITATVAKDDTVTVDQLTTLVDAKAFIAATGVEVACTVATNVVTITEDPLASTKCVFIVIGS